MWSERLAPAYFSKGPGIAFAIRASTAVFGANEFGVRFFSPLLAAGTSLLLFYFARRLFNATAGLWAVIALNVTPIFNIGAFLMTIDRVVDFFLAGGDVHLLACVGKKPAVFLVLAVDRTCSLGSGFFPNTPTRLSSFRLYWCLPLRPGLGTNSSVPAFICCLAMFALCTVPPIMWNAQHAWITLAHLRSRGGLEHGFGFHPVEVLSFLGQHFLAYSPFLFLAIGVGRHREAGVE